MTRATQKITYDDYASFLPDGSIHQVLDGALYMTPAPNPVHQRLVKRLLHMLEAYFEQAGDREVFISPIDVILTRHDVVQPDLVVVSNPAQVSARGIEGAPLLVVEILSPSSVATDRQVKLERYARLHVAHYWIVDPDAQRLECYRNAGGRYALVVEAVAPASLGHPDFPGLAVDLRAVWPEEA